MKVISSKLSVILLRKVLFINDVGSSLNPPLQINNLFFF